MLRIRISGRLWETSKDPELLVSQLSNYLARHVVWIWRQPARYRAEDGSWREGAERPVMLSLEKDALLKLVLRTAEGTGADYQLVALRKARQVEVYEAVTGRSLKGETFQILRPWESVTDIAVIIHSSYLKLAPHLKNPIIMAWNRLVRGMKQRKARLGQDTLFLLTHTGALDKRLVEDLDNALADAGGTNVIGQIITDRYEIKRAAEMCEKYGQACG